MTSIKRGVVGMLDPVCRWATRGSVRTLMYHRFSATPVFDQLSARHFDAHIRFLSRHFVPCRLSALTARLRKGDPLPPNLVVVTVDDGYADFREVAYPVLKRYGVPATLYVTTRFADQSMWLWPDRLRYCVEHASRCEHRVIEIAGSRHQLVLADAASREAAWQRLGDACLPLTPAEREQTLAAIEVALGVRLPPRPPDEFRAMTWDEIRGLDPEVVEIGSHTCSHPVLSKCSDEELETEVVSSKAVIEREIGRPVVSFAYPNGQARDYDARVVRRVRKAGYESAVVAHGSFVRPGADLLALERLEPPHQELEFRRVICGFPEVLTRTRLRPLLAALVAW